MLVNMADLFNSASNLLSAGGGIAGTIMNYISGVRANDTNIALARENRQFMLDQWHRENAYNLPSAQMQRLAVAGLNPNLVYGDGGATMPSVSMDAVESARVSAPKVDPLTLAQIDRLSAETESIRHSTQREDEKQPLTLENLKSQIVTASENIAKIRSAVDLDKSMSARQRAETRKTLNDLSQSIDGWSYELRILKNKAKLSDDDADFYRDKLAADLAATQNLASLYFFEGQYYKSKPSLERQSMRLQEVLGRERNAIYRDQVDNLRDYNAIRLEQYDQELQNSLVRTAAYVSYLGRMETHMTVKEIEDGFKMLTDLVGLITKRGLVTETIKTKSRDGRTESTYTHNRRHKK